MTLLRALPLPTAQRLTGTGSPVESLRRAGFRARVLGGWLNVWGEAPLTPGARYKPRERADSEGLWRHIPRPDFAALNEQAERERDRVRNEGLARFHRERREARRSAMDDAMRELGRRAIAAGFVWVHGARTTSGQRVVCIRPNENPIACHEDNGYTIHLAGGQTPDFSDPATLGCLLAQVRERWQRGEAHASPNFRGGWNVLEDSIVRDCWPESLGSGQTEAAALVAALEAAPKVAP